MLAFDQAPGFSPLFTKLPTKARDVNSCYSRSNMSSIHEPLKKKDQRSSRVKTPAKIVEEERMRRRHLSLAKVKESGEARRWVARSEQILYQDHKSQRTKWEEEQAKLAKQQEVSTVEAEEAAMALQGSSIDLELVDDFVDQENQYLQSMALMMPSYEAEAPVGRSPPFDFGSDDDEYVQAVEDLFRTCEGTCLSDHSRFATEADRSRVVEQIDSEMG